MPTKLTAPLLLLAAAFVLAGGYIHLTEWQDVYRDLPDQVPGAWVVKEGFLVNAVTSALVAGALVAVAFMLPKLRRLVIVGAVGFQAVSLAVLIRSRTGTIFEWTEPVWTPAANQSRAVEIGAIVCLVAALALDLAIGRASTTEPTPA